MDTPQSGAGKAALVMVGGFVEGLHSDKSGCVEFWRVFDLPTIVMTWQGWGADCVRGKGIRIWAAVTQVNAKIAFGLKSAERAQINS